MPRPTRGYVGYLTRRAARKYVQYPDGHDRLIGRDAGLAWLIEPTSTVAAAETYVLIRIAGHDLDANEYWLARALAELLAALQRLDNAQENAQ